MKKIYLVRHGESFANARHRLQGSTDTSLTENGMKQALDAAKKLEGISFGSIYSGRLKRQKETAEIIKDVLDIDAVYVTDKRLDEVDYGLLEGEKEDNVFFRMFTDFNERDIVSKIRKIGTKRLLELTAMQDPYGTLEKPENAFFRFCSFMEEIMKGNNLNENVLVVTSGAIASLFLQEYEWNVSTENNVILQNGSIVKVVGEKKPESFKLI